MHKIRNTKHKETLESLYGIVAPGCSVPLSKKTLRKLLTLYGWERWRVKEVIEKGEWWYPFCED